MIDRYSLPEMSAIWTEEARFGAMMEVEIAAAEAMAELGTVPKDAAWTIRTRARFDVKRINEIEKVTQHDVIAFVSNLAESIGPAGRYLHLGMTSSDVLDTGLAVQMKKAAALLAKRVDALLAALKVQAEKYRDTPMIGRTHGIHAEPITFGLKLALFHDELGRARDRLRAVQKEVAAGKISGAVGTYAHLDPQVEEGVCKRLGLTPAPTSSQIIPRDRHAAFLNWIAISGASLERLALEIRHLQRTEVAEAFEPFGKGQKGSSAMPHKRNPILCERICWMSRLLRANAMAALENVALWHERDISHSSVERVILPDSCIALDYMLVKAAGLVENLDVRPERMKANLDASHGLWASESVLLALVEKGLTREAAYALVQKSAMESWRTGKPFVDLLSADPELKKHLPAARIKGLVNLPHALRNIPRVFERLGLAGGAPTPDKKSEKAIRPKKAPRPAKKKKTRG